MTGLDVFAILVMLVVAAGIIYAAVFLGALPGKTARKRNHPQADAINVCGWLGLLTLGILWPIAFIWAYLRPGREPVSEAALSFSGAEDESSLAQEIRNLRSRIAFLESKIQKMT